MQMPSNAQNGKYQVKCEGILDTEAGGYVFYNVTDIPFDAKQASVFIQLSRPIYKQGQSGKHASVCDYYMYRKVPQFSDARKLCCNLPKFQTKKPYLRYFVKKMQMELQIV